MVKTLLTFENRDEWRQWLVANHSNEEEAWLVHYKKGAARAGLTYDHGVEEALCFGWIDGKLKSIDSEKFMLRYTPRRHDSVWSYSNVVRVERLIAENKMTDAGLKKVKEAHENGQWDAAIQREQVDVIPPELERVLRRRKGALSAYRGLPPSRKKQYIYWITSAKRVETQQKRIQTIIEEIMSPTKGNE